MSLVAAVDVLRACAHSFGSVGAVLRHVAEATGAPLEGPGSVSTVLAADPTGVAVPPAGSGRGGAVSVATLGAGSDLRQFPGAHGGVRTSRELHERGTVLAEAALLRELRGGGRVPLSAVAAAARDRRCARCAAVARGARGGEGGGERCARVGVLRTRMAPRSQVRGACGGRRVAAAARAGWGRGG